MAVKISGVEPRSIACKNGISKGDTLLTVNGHKISDVLDYRFYLTEKKLELSLLSDKGEPYEKLIIKREYDDLGLEFETYLMDKQRFCRNKCVFCFVDQMPPDMRETLYFKDDDSRMSFLFGNYITLTNLTDEDVERIIAMRTSPVNISVHTMNPELRVKMMKNKHAGDSLRFIKQLTAAGIKVNSQLVVCPGINDGAELEFSLRELSMLAPDLQSIAVVPVGLTKFRDNLPELRLFTRVEAKSAIRLVEKLAAENIKAHGLPICYAADELYLKAEIPLPDYDSYGDFDQLENGVGLMRLLSHDFYCALEDKENFTLNRTITMATGVAAKPLIEELANAAAQQFKGLHIKVIAVENRFFGESITVAGLVTGVDLIARLKGEDIGDELLFPAVMLRHERDLFLDDISVADVERELNCKAIPVENDGFKLLDAMLGIHERMPPT